MTRNYYTGDKAVAWDAVKAAYRRRVCGSAGPAFEIPRTDFDFKSVAMAADLPGPPDPNWRRSTPNNPNAHYRAAVTALYRLREIFEQEWGR